MADEFDEPYVPTTSSLLTPLGRSGVLIPDERVRYEQRKHLASLLRPFFETVGTLLLVILFANTSVITSGGGLVAILALVIGVLVFRSFRGRKRSRALTYLLFGVALLVVAFVPEPSAALMSFLVIGITVRFLYIASMWAFFERLYITNRRVIHASGFLGAEIAMMPLVRVTDIHYTRSILGEVLGYANLRVESAGQDQALSLITYIERPSEFYSILVTLSTAAVGSVTETDDEA